MDPLVRQVRKARWRIGLRRCLAALGWCWFVALGVAVILVTVDRFWPLGVAPWVWPAGAVAAGLLAAAGWAVVRDGGPLEAAMEIDHRFGLKERISSAVAIPQEERQTALGQALVQDARRRAERIDVRSGLPVRPGRQIFLPLVPALLLALVMLLLSPAGGDKSKQAAANPAISKQVQQSAASLKRKLIQQKKKAEQQGLEEATDLFDKLARGTEELTSKPISERKQALAELNDLKRQIEKRRQNLEGAQRMRDQLRNLRDIDRGPADRLVEEIRRGNFQAAMKQLQKLKESLKGGDLTPEQRRQLAKQLEQMKQKLEEMADAHKQAMKDLQKRIEQARAEGRQEEANKLQEMLDALRQQLPQMDQFRDMANQLGQCARALNDGNLREADDLLDNLTSQLEDLQQQLDELQLLDEAMDQLTQCRNQMNCPFCGGAGCRQCQGQPGVGLGEGRGLGERPEAEDDVGFYNAQSPVNVQKGEAIVVGSAGWSAVRGNVPEQIQQQYEATRRAEADPLTGVRLPRRMREGVRQYFDDFREGD